LKTQVGRAEIAVFLALVLFVHTLVGGSSAKTGAFLVGAFPAAGRSPLAFHQQAINISASERDSRYPALAVSDGIAHIVWEENERVYHSYSRGETWSSGRSVAVGEQPAIAADAPDRAHVVFVNLFGGNYEIYHCRWNGISWSLPRNVSNTSGVSSAPSLAIAPDGTVHVVWADNTPGYNVIYHAYWNGTYWINEPIPHAMGGAPAVAVGRDAALHVVWQDRDWPDAPYEIYYSRRDDGDWSLPENLSDSATQPSIIPTVAADPDGQAHVGWQEKEGGQYAIYYTLGRVGFWSVPERISNGEGEAYLPSLAVSRSKTAYLGWDESTLALYRQRGVVDASWSQTVQVTRDPMGVVGLQLAVESDGRLHSAWARRTASGKWDVFYQYLSFKLVLPIALKSYLG
jgi:hypothetical protein